LVQLASWLGCHREGLMLASCLCCTYGRVHLLEEAIESFLRQDYAGDKELVILNDLDTQELVFWHPEVCVVNVPRRFHTLGEKRNAVTALARGDVLTPWDDDDISLPWRLSLSAERLQGRRYWKPTAAWSWRRNRPMDVSRNRFHGQAVFTRELFDEAGGYPHQQQSTDPALESKFGAARVCEDLAPEQLFYIYRWGHGTYHMSAHKADGAAQWAALKAPRGRIELRPQWRADYVADARKAVAQLRGDMS